MGALLNEDSEDHLIAVTEVIVKRPVSAEISVISDVSAEATPKASESSCLRLPPFAVNIGFNVDT
jgi:hypothetical protein